HMEIALAKFDTIEEPQRSKEREEFSERLSQHLPAQDAPLTSYTEVTDVLNTEENEQYIPSISEVTHTKRPSSELPQFSSRFFNDFKPSQIIGWGAFEIVFKAKNIFDKGTYAVKRIQIRTTKYMAL
ncbi:hypothetical protein PFISCL1PPCAC_28451, partial [Pristionchus fissidentatus]